MVKGMKNENSKKNLELILLILISICGYFHMTNVLISIRKKEAMHIK